MKTEEIDFEINFDKYLRARNWLRWSQFRSDNIKLSPEWHKFIYTSPAHIKSRPQKGKIEKSRAIRCRFATDYLKHRIRISPQAFSPLNKGILQAPFMKNVRVPNTYHI